MADKPGTHALQLDFRQVWRKRLRKEPYMSTTPKPTEQIYDIPLNQIDVSDDNVRVTDRNKEVDELAASIKAKGLLQPVILEGTPGTPRYKLIVGQRRLLAHKALGRKSILARFVPHIDSIEAMVRSLVENMQRVELNHADAAKAVMKLYSDQGKNEKKVCQITGLSMRRVREYIQVESFASDETKKKLKRKQVELVDVKRALRAANYDSAKADRILDKMKEHELTSYQKKTLVEYAEANPSASVEKLVKEASAPRIDYKALMLNIPVHLQNGLSTAAETLSMGVEEIILKAVADWLSDQGFVHA